MMERKICVLALVLISFLTGCIITPKRASIDDRYKEAKKDVNLIFSSQEKLSSRLNFYEAMARGIKHNLDYRIKIANNALTMGQLRLAEFAMYPALNVTHSTYTRDNDLSSSSLTSSGQISGISNSTPRTLQSQRIAISWNVFDFGLSYLKAKQQADAQLIARTETHRQMQHLAQDILTAYWEAYSAQELIKLTGAFKKTLEMASNQMKAAVLDKSIPQENLLRYQEALLKAEKHLAQLKFKYDKAIYDLKHLLNIRLEKTLTLAPLPDTLLKTPDLSLLNFKKLDAITLVLRPELEGQHYREKIAKGGTKMAILQALPGITLNAGWNYNSNKFLLNSRWLDRTLDLAWSLINLASLPASLDSAKDQAAYEKLKKMALTLGVLTETRYAFSNYQHLRTEYNISKKLTKTIKALYILSENREKASLTSHQQVLGTQIKFLTAKMDENLMMANLSKANGELYLSIGFDMIPEGISNEPLDVIIKKIKKRISTNHQMDLTKYVDNTYNRLFGKKNQTLNYNNTLPIPWTPGLPLPLDDGI